MPQPFAVSYDVVDPKKPQRKPMRIETIIRANSRKDAIKQVTSPLTINIKVEGPQPRQVA